MQQDSPGIRRHGVHIFLDLFHSKYRRLRHRLRLLRIQLRVQPAVVLDQTSVVQEYPQSLSRAAVTDLQDLTFSAVLNIQILRRSRLRTGDQI